MPVELAALRSLMQEGRTSWAHFLRTSVYAWSGVCLFLVAWSLIFALAFDKRPFMPTHDTGFITRRDPAPWGVAVLWLWGLIWWYYAARDYLRYKRPLLVAGVVASCSAATAFGLVWLWTWRDAVLSL